jgi:hypothetical protein
MKSSKRGVVTPAGLLPELDKFGVILLKHRRNFPVGIFRELNYLGRLEGKWVEDIRDFLDRDLKTRISNG